MLTAIAFSLVVEFCSPVICEEYVIDHSLTQEDCSQAHKLASGIYNAIPHRVLYTHFADTYGAEYMEGYPIIIARSIECKLDI